MRSLGDTNTATTTSCERHHEIYWPPSNSEAGYRGGRCSVTLWWTQRTSNASCPECRGHVLYLRGRIIVGQEARNEEGDCLEPFMPYSWVVHHRSLSLRANHHLLCKRPNFCSALHSYINFYHGAVIVLLHILLTCICILSRMVHILTAQAP